MSESKITRRRRLLALAGVAVIMTIPLTLAPAVHSIHAFAESSSPALVKVSLPTSVSFADVVAADKPAVVTVVVKESAPGGMGDQMGGSQFGSGSPMDEFLHRFFNERGPNMPMRPVSGLGSGFVISEDGLIVTNNHVIENADKISVVLDDGAKLTASIVGRDEKSDLAVIKVKADRALPAIQWGDSDDLRLGDPVIAIGNPFGLGTTVTAGIVSARGRDLHSGPYDDFIQVDAAINRGNSGGPLIDATGQVVGINSAIYTPNGGNIGVPYRRMKHATSLTN
jgi:serine protease Do